MKIQDLKHGEFYVAKSIYSGQSYLFKFDSISDDYIIKCFPDYYNLTLSKHRYASHSGLMDVKYMINLRKATENEINILISKYPEYTQSLKKKLKIDHKQFKLKFTL